MVNTDAPTRIRDRPVLGFRSVTGWETDLSERGTVNILEEGLATWFQNEPAYHDEQVQRYIAMINEQVPAYAEAHDSARQCMPEILQAVKELRASGEQIGSTRVSGVNFESLGIPFYLKW